MSNEGMAEAMSPEVFQQAIAQGDELTVASALPGFVFSVLGRNNVAEPHAAVALDDDGGRSLIVFTTRAAADAFGSTLRLLPVLGSNIPGLAAHYNATRVRLDPSGPHPVKFEVARWQMLLDGISVVSGETSLPGLTVSEWPDAPETLRSALAGSVLPARLLMFVRVIEGRRIPTIGIDERPATGQLGPRLAQSLGGIGGFEYLDVLELEPELADRIVEAIPDSVVRG